jgi:hypothetical protein
VQHRSAPDHRSVVAGQERHRDELDSVLFRRNDLLAVGGELGLQAQHDRHVRAVDVAVDHRDAAAALAERDGEVHRHGRLADAALAGADGDDVLDAGHWSLAGIGPERRPDLRRHLDVDPSHPGKAADHVTRLIAHLVLDRTGRRGELDGEANATIGYPKILDELQRDDIAVEIGIPNGRQGLEDGCLRGLRGAHDAECIVLCGRSTPNLRSAARRCPRRSEV